MATLSYRGRSLEVNSGKDLYEIVQLLLTDLGDVGAKLSAKDAQDQNRDRWLQQFAQWTGAQVARLSQNGQQGILPLSITSLFASKAKALTAPTTQTPAPAPAAPVSPHRVEPGPQGAGLASSLASITAISGSTDRAHRFALDFTAAYNGTTPVAEVSFHTPYPSPPVVILQQEDALTNRNFHCISVSTTGYVFMCDDFGAAEQHVLQALVIHPSDPAD